VEFRILGHLEVVEEGQPLALTVGKQRSLLAILLLHANEVVSRDRLIDELWGAQAPASAAKSIQIYISQLRKALGEGAARLLTRPNGYEFLIVPNELDLHRFDDLVEEARRAPSEQAAVKFRAALALWRGPPLADFRYESFAQAEIARLEELRLTVVEERITADLALGPQPDLVGELEALVAAHPLRERLRGLLMIALYRSGRQAEALQVYRKTRDALVEELGLEPSRELQELEQAILRQDPSLGASPLAEAARDAVAESARPSTVVEGVSRHPVALFAGGAIVLAAAIGSAFLLTRGSGSGGIDHVTANSVGAIDLKTNKIVASVPVGIRPGPLVYGYGQLWVANLDNETVSRVDPEAKAQTDVVSLGAQPNALAVRKTAIWATTNRGIKAIDPAFDDVRTISFGKPKPRTALFYSAPTAIAFTRAYAWLVIGSHIARADPTTGSRVDTIRTGNEPAALAAGASNIWVSDTFDNAVARLDPSGVITATTSVGRSPSSIAVGPDAVWVADALDDDVKRVDPDTATVVTTIHVGHHPSAIAVSKGAVWVANQDDGTVWRIDERSNTVVKKIKVGGSPAALAVADGLLWVSVQPSPLVPSGSLAKGGGVARINLDAPSVDPADQDTFTLGAVQWEYATCAKLLNYPDKTGPEGSQLQPELARSMPSVSRDGGTYTFRIRRGYRFSPPSNQPVTAEAIKYTIERSLSPVPEFLAASYVGDIVGEAAYRKGKARHISGVIARGSTLTIKLRRAAGDFPVRISMAFFCVVPTNTPIRRVETPIPSAGPYYIDTHRGTQIVLKRNPNYAGSRPHRLRAIVYTGSGSQSKGSVARVVAGRADYVPLEGARSGARVDQLNIRYGLNSPPARRGHQQLFINPATEVDGLFLNTSRPLFANARLRRAVNYAINRRALTRFGGIFFATGPLSATTTDQYLPPAARGFRDVAIYPLEGDLAKARRLAGGVRRKVVLYTCTFSPCPQWAQVVKANLAAIGMTVEIRAFPLEDLFTRTTKRGEPWDIGLLTWSVDYPDPSDVLNYMFEGDYIGRAQAANWERFDDPVFNRRLRAAAELSGAGRYREYARLDADLARDAAPIVAFANENRIDLFSARMGCQLYHPVYGMDLAVLCVKPVSRSP
jgi:YVTN family beta-propeller protein